MTHLTETPAPTDFNELFHQLQWRELSKLPPGARTVLSGGCAGFWYFEWFSEHYPTPVDRHLGVDAYAPQRESLPPGVEWVQDTLGNLESGSDETVDLIFAGRVLEHLWPGEVGGFLTEAHRVLSPGGHLVLDSPNRRVTEGLRWTQPEHTIEFTVEEAVDLLRSSRLRIDSGTRHLALLRRNPGRRFMKVPLLFALEQTTFNVEFCVLSNGRRALSAQLQAQVDEQEADRRLPPSQETATRPPTTRSVSQMTVGARRGIEGGLRMLGRKALWPVRRFVDPRIAGLLQYLDARFAHINRRLDSLEGAAFGGLAVDAATEATTLMGQSLADLLAESEQIAARLEHLEQIAARLEHLTDTVDQLASEVGHGAAYFDRLSEASVDDLDENAARLLNSALGHRGFAAQHGLWFNPPISLRHSEGSVEVTVINERIVEVPYALRALARLTPGAAVLDVGAAESTLSLSLATLGYDVVALDPRGYPLSHPRLRSVQSRVEEWQHAGTFDAIVCLSTIEHIGLATYEQHEGSDGTDLAAMRRMHELAKPGAVLVLTTSFGRARMDSFTRTYDQDGLDALLDGWSIHDMSIAVRTSPVQWNLQGNDHPASESIEKVVLVTATRPK